MSHPPADKSRKDRLKAMAVDIAKRFVCDDKDRLKAMAIDIAKRCVCDDS